MIRTMSDVSWGKRLLLKLEDEMRSRAQCRRETRRFASLSEALEHQAREVGGGAAQGSHAGGQVPPGDQPVIWYESAKTLILPHGLLKDGSGEALLVVPSTELHLRGQEGEAGGGRRIERGATVISRPLELSDGSSGSLSDVQLQVAAAPMFASLSLPRSPPPSRLPSPLPGPSSSSSLFSSTPPPLCVLRLPADADCDVSGRAMILSMQL